MICSWLLFSCILGNDLILVDGLDDRIPSNKADVQRQFEYLRTNFNSRISRIMKDACVTDINMVIEYRRVWHGSITTVLFSPSFIVAANTLTNEVESVKKNPLSEVEREKIEEFRFSKWAYRYGSRSVICDLSRIFVFYVENGRVVSVQCFEPPVFANKEPKCEVMPKDLLSEVARNRFKDVLDIVSPLLTDLHHEIQSRRDRIRTEERCCTDENR